MERDHHSPECPDATDLMCGLTRELSSLKSVNLFLLSSHLYYFCFLSSPFIPITNLSRELDLCSAEGRNALRKVSLLQSKGHGRSQRAGESAPQQ